MDRIRSRSYSATRFPEQALTKKYQVFRNAASTWVVAATTMGVTGGYIWAWSFSKSMGHEMLCVWHTSSCWYLEDQFSLLLLRIGRNRTTNQGITCKREFNHEHVPPACVIGGNARSCLLC